MTMRSNPHIRRVRAQAAGFIQSPLGVGGATFASISLVDVIAQLGPNGILVASIGGIVTYIFKDEIFTFAGKAIGRTYVSDDEVNAHMREQGLLPTPDESDTPEDKDKNATPPPQVYRYDDIKHLIPANRTLLGVHPGTGKLELTRWQKLKCLWIAGTSSTGKSNTVYGKAREAVDTGAQLLVVDQHINKPDSLGRKLAAFEASFLRPIAVTDEEVLAVLSAFKAEFERRVEGASIRQRIVLICDEMGRMARNPRLLKALKEIVAICGEESRGFNMYGWFLSQKAVGLKWLRDSAITVIVHRMTRIEEARLACNDDTSVARQNLKYPIGRTFVYGVDFEEMELQQALYMQGRTGSDEDWDEDWESDDDQMPGLGKRRAHGGNDPLDVHTLVGWLEHGDIDEAEFLTLMKLRGKSEVQTPRVVDADQPRRNMDVAALRALPYQEYLKTDHWQRQRKAALERNKKHCQVCRAEGVQLEVHHNTYARLGCEEPDDLCVLCEECHELFSKGGKLAEKQRMEDLQPRREKAYVDEGEAEGIPEEAQIVPILPDKRPKAEDIDINILCACWNGGVNTVSKIEATFKMSHSEAYKAYKRIKAQRGEPIDEQEWQSFRCSFIRSFRHSTEKWQKMAKKNLWRRNGMMERIVCKSQHGKRKDTLMNVKVESFTRGFFWFGYAVFLSASIPHIAAYFRHFDPATSIWIENTFYWTIAVLLAVVIDVSDVLVSIAVMKAQASGAKFGDVFGFWVFILLIMALSWFFNWQYNVVFGTNDFHAVDQNVIWGSITVGQINPVIGSAFQLLLLVYTGMAHKFTQKPKVLSLEDLKKEADEAEKRAEHQTRINEVKKAQREQSRHNYLESLRQAKEEVTQVIQGSKEPSTDETKDNVSLTQNASSNEAIEGVNMDQYQELDQSHNEKTSEDAGSIIESKTQGKAPLKLQSFVPQNGSTSHAYAPIQEAVKMLGYDLQYVKSLRTKGVLKSPRKNSNLISMASIKALVAKKQSAVKKQGKGESTNAAMPGVTPVMSPSKEEGLEQNTEDVKGETQAVHPSDTQRDTSHITQNGHAQNAGPSLDGFPEMLV